MNRVEIRAKLVETYASFNAFLSDLSEDEFEYAPPGKWNAGQQAEHLIKSTKPLLSGLGVPKMMISVQFGKANRPSKTYPELVERYQEKLADNNGPGPATFAPGRVAFSDVQKLVRTQKEIIEKIVGKLDNWSGKDMDKYVFPHPLLGKVTVREMMYFTIYHADHHKGIIKLYLRGV